MIRLHIRSAIASKNQVCARRPAILDDALAPSSLRPNHSFTQKDLLLGVFHVDIRSKFILNQIHK